MGEAPSDPHQWTAAHVAAYLRSVNLAEKYVKVIEEEEINGIVFTGLTKADLKEEPFHISGFGPLRTATEAIEHMKALRRKVDEAGPTPSFATPSAAPAPAPPAAADTPAPSEPPPQKAVPAPHVAAHPARGPTTSPHHGHAHMPHHGAPYDATHAPAPPPMSLTPQNADLPPLSTPPLEQRMGGVDAVPFVPGGMHMGPPPGPMPVRGLPLGMPPILGGLEPWHGFFSQHSQFVPYPIGDVPVGLTFPECPPCPSHTDFSFETLWQAAHSNRLANQDHHPHGGAGTGGAPIRPAGGEQHHATPRGPHMEAMPPANQGLPPMTGNELSQLLDHAGEAAGLHHTDGLIEFTEPGVEEPVGATTSAAQGQEARRQAEEQSQLQLVLGGNRHTVPVDDMSSSSPPPPGGNFKRPKPIAEFEFGNLQQYDADVRRKMKLVGARVEPLDDYETNLTFAKVDDQTDLTKPPVNWLNDDERIARVHNPGNVVHPTKEFLTTSLGMSAPDADKIDFIAHTENLKKLYTAPFTQQDLSLSVHKVGNTLVIEDVNTQAMKKPTDLMMSKLLYYSILAGDKLVDEKKSKVAAAAAAAPSGADSAAPAEQPAEPEPSASQPSGEKPDKPKPDAQFAVPDGFYRNMKWHFQDLNLLLGSDQLVMKQDEGANEVALKLRDIDQPLAPSDALEYWLDNVMNNVPQVAICYHKDGVTQGYQLINTGEIPTMTKEARFEPQIVQEYAGNVLHWLKENCTREAGSYILVREAGKTLKLYDLSSIYDEVEKGQASQESGDTALVQTGGNQVQVKRDVPFAYPVAMLCFRMGSKLTDSQSPLQAQKAVQMLQKAIVLLPDDTYPEIRAQAHAYLATAYILSKRAEAGQQEQANKPFDIYDELEGYSLAADELCKALLTLEKYDESSDRLELRERLTHCYLELAVRCASKDELCDCLQWIAKAEQVITSTNKTTEPLALMPPPGFIPDSPLAVGNVPSPVPPTIPSQVIQATARLMETVGDLHQAVSRVQLSNAEFSLTPLQELVQRLAAGTHPSSVIRRCMPVSLRTDDNINKALEMYYSAIKQVAMMEGVSAEPSGIEVIYSTQADLRMKLGRMYNLWATRLVRENRLHNASEQFRKAYTCFSDPAAEVGRATAAMNLGKLLMTLAATNAGDAPTTLSENEESFTNKALSYYQDAVQILSNNKGHASLFHDAQMLSANSQRHLAKRIKHHFVALTEQSTDVDYEKRCADLLQSAMQTYSALSDEALVAETDAHLGQLYYITLHRNYVGPSERKAKAAAQTQRQERRFKMSEVHFSRAAEFYAANKHHCMYLKLRRDITRLHLFQLTSNAPTQQYLKTVVRTLLKVHPWMSNSKELMQQGDQRELQEELRSQLALMRDVLQEAMTVYSNVASTPPKRQLSKAQERRLNPINDLKELHTKAAGAVPDADLLKTATSLLDSISKLILRE